MNKHAINKIRDQIFSSQIINKKLEIVCFPKHLNSDSQNVCFDSNQHRILTYFSMNLLSDALLCLLSKCFKNTWYHFSTLIINFQTTKMKSTYFKDNLERSLFKILSVLETENDTQYMYVPSLETQIQLRTENYYKHRYLICDLVNYRNRGNYDSASSSCNLFVELPEKLIKLTRADWKGSLLLGLPIQNHEETKNVYQTFIDLSNHFYSDEKLKQYEFETCLSVGEISTIVHMLILEELCLTCSVLQRINPICVLLQKTISQQFFEEAILIFELIKTDMFERKSEEQVMESFDHLVKDDQKKQSRILEDQVHPDIPSNPVKLIYRDKSYLETTCKINELESRICVIEFTLKKFLASFLEKHYYEKSIEDSITLVIRQKHKKSIEFISKFFMLMSSDIKPPNYYDYESVLFFEKLNLIMYSLYNSYSSNICMLLLKYPKTTLKNVNQAFQKLPFLKLYSFDFGSLVKKLLTEFKIER